MPRTSTIDIHKPLHDIFGFSAFRPNQEQIVRALQNGRDVFAVMPTGGGKSLCYQLPAYVLPGTALVISPLISLMKDQVDAAVANGVRAAFINSSQSDAQRRAVYRRLYGGDLDILYAAPERLAVASFDEALDACRLNLIAIDEAHCISEWGHDFRPDYLALSGLTERFKSVPIAAFTATATLRVSEDIKARLNLRDPLTIRASFDRPNLYYQVCRKTGVQRQIKSFIETRAGQAGIVYHQSRKGVEKTADFLNACGIRALPYHAGLADERRCANQEAFNRDEVEVIVATIAFGMGIDKSNIRFVIHADLPKNIESYYQETGRAGRDGLQSHCLLLYSGGDIPKIKYFISQVCDETERKRLLRALGAMSSYARVFACRRRQLLAYFGETYEKDNCGTCDICTETVETSDATVDAQKVLSAVMRTGSRFGIGHIVDVVSGADSQKVKRFGHDRIKTYGVGKDQPKTYWRRIVEELIAQEVLQQEDSQFPVLRPGAGARDVLIGKRSIMVCSVHHTKEKRRRSRTTSHDAGPADQDLFEVLRRKRMELARSLGVPPYIIFNDRTLQDMARKKPRSEDELLDIVGVGQAKLQRFGKEFLAVIRESELG